VAVDRSGYAFTWKGSAWSKPEPFQVSALPWLSTATQKEALAQDTEVR
jgi:hypothetical protein